MPRIEMRDAFGASFRIDATNRNTLQAWFDELLPKMYPADADDGLGDPLIMSVWPMDLDGSGWDWPADARYMTEPFTIPRDPALVLAALDRRREEIEAKVRALEHEPDA